MYTKIFLSEKYFNDQYIIWFYAWSAFINKTNREVFIYKGILFIWKLYSDILFKYLKNPNILFLNITLFFTCRKIRSSKILKDYSFPRNLKVSAFVKEASQLPSKYLSLTLMVPFINVNVKSMGAFVKYKYFLWKINILNSFFICVIFLKDVAFFSVL